MERKLLISKALQSVTMTMGLSSLAVTLPINLQGNVSSSYRLISTLLDLWRKACFKVPLLFGLLGFISMLIPAIIVFKERLSWWIDCQKEQEFGKSKVCICWVDSEGVCIREAEYEEHLSEEKILRAISPYTELFPSLLEYFLKGRHPPGLSVLTTKGKKKTEVTIDDFSQRKLVIHL